jgi:hypothetical protein
MRSAINLGVVNPRPTDAGKLRLARQNAPSYISDFAWRLTHAVGEVLALLWGIGALGAVCLFVAGIIG